MYRPALRRPMARRALLVARSTSLVDTLGVPAELGQPLLFLLDHRRAPYPRRLGKVTGLPVTPRRGTFVTVDTSAPTP